MSFSAFPIERITLAAATITPIPAPDTRSSVGIVNETGGDVLVSSDAGGTQYVTLADGFVLSIDFGESGSSTVQFQRGQISFYLFSTGGGPVALLWV